MNYIITNGTLLLPDGESLKTEKADLYIKDGVIAAVGGTAPENFGDFETVDASGRLIMPGLINMHTHAYMTLLRNYADDVDFSEWLFNRCMPVEDRLPVEAAYWTSLLGCMEMISTGTTCFVDMHMYHEQSCRAANTAGMRGYIGRGLVGEDLYTDGLSRFQGCIDEQEKYGSDMLKFVLSPHAIYTCSEKLLRQVTEESEKRGMLRQTHLSESETEVDDAIKKFGRTPVEVMRDTGFLGKKTILAHCVQMRGDDISIIAESGSSVVTNPASNAKLGNGFAPIEDLRRAGVNVCLGTDGTASNNTLNMFREMGLLSLIHKGIHRSSVTAPATFVVDTATRNAAKSLHREGELGVIAPGAKADIIFIDLTAPSMFPNNNCISALCYSANGSEVESVMINGKFVMRNREYAGIDREQVLYEVGQIAKKYL